MRGVEQEQSSYVERERRACCLLIFQIQTASVVFIACCVHGKSVAQSDRERDMDKTMKRKGRKTKKTMKEQGDEQRERKRDRADRRRRDERKRHSAIAFVFY